MPGVYHNGEIEAQERAGVRDLSERVGRIIQPAIAPAAASFLEHRSFIVTATIGGAVHASLLAGWPGFARATSDTAIEIRPDRGHIQTVFADLASESPIGILAIDFSTKRRMRVNGVGTVSEGALFVRTREVYSNCPQYIHQRDDSVPSLGTDEHLSDALSESEQTFIRKADTFFIASVHPVAGADASHRGGPGRFIDVDAHTLRWPDFAGNNMFNTIGNLLIEPRCALLFVDFVKGATVRVEGDAIVQWDPDRSISVAVRSVISAG